MKPILIALVLLGLTTSCGDVCIREMVKTENEKRSRFVTAGKGSTACEGVRGDQARSR